MRNADAADEAGAGAYAHYAVYGPCFPGPLAAPILRALAAIVPTAPPLALAHGADEFTFFLVYIANTPFMVWYCLSVIIAVADTPSCFRAGSYLLVSSLAYTALWFATPIGLAWTLAILYSGLALAHRLWIIGPDCGLDFDDRPRPTSTRSARHARREGQRPAPGAGANVFWLVVQSPRGTARHVVPIRVAPPSALP